MHRTQRPGQLIEVAFSQIHAALRRVEPLKDDLGLTGQHNLCSHCKERHHQHSASHHVHSCFQWL